MRVLRFSDDGVSKRRFRTLVFAFAQHEPRVEGLVQMRNASAICTALEVLLGKSFAELQQGEEFDLHAQEIVLEEAPYEQLLKWLETTKPWATGTSMHIIETHEWLKEVEKKDASPGKSEPQEA